MDGLYLWLYHGRMSDLGHHTPYLYPCHVRSLCRSHNHGRDLFHNPCLCRSPCLESARDHGRMSPLSSQSHSFARRIYRTSHCVCPYRVSILAAHAHAVPVPAFPEASQAGSCVRTPPPGVAQPELHYVLRSAHYPSIKQCATHSALPASVSAPTTGSSGCWTRARSRALG